jgi:two-component system chemotaxis response regulator CheB
MAYELVVLGGSWGALAAYDRILPQLPKDFPAAIVVIQHRPVDSQHGALIGYLQQRSPLPCSEIDDKDPIAGGRIYLAPPDYHTIVEPGHFALSTEAAVRHSRPSIDVSFETAADSYGDRLVGVVLTGANDDGAEGVKAIKRQGGLTIAQDPETAEKHTMPQAAIATGEIDRVVALDEIGPMLTALCGADATGTVTAA